MNNETYTFLKKKGSNYFNNFIVCICIRHCWGGRWRTCKARSPKSDQQLKANYWESLLKQGQSVTACFGSKDAWSTSHSGGRDAAAFPIQRAMQTKQQILLIPRADVSRNSTLRVQVTASEQTGEVTNPEQHGITHHMLPAAACSCLLALDVVKPSTQTLLSHLPTRPPLQQEHLHLLCSWCRSLGLGASTPVWSNLWKRWFECTSTAWYQGCCAVILMQWAKRCPTANTPRVHDT